MYQICLNNAYGSFQVSNKIQASIRVSQISTLQKVCQNFFSLYCFIVLFIYQITHYIIDQIQIRNFCFFHLYYLLSLFQFLFPPITPLCSPIFFEFHFLLSLFGLTTVHSHHLPPHQNWQPSCDSIFLYLFWSTTF